jgi:hypothetical protein
MKIDSYRFGEIVIGGGTFRSDVLILPGGVRSGWWRLEGHRLHLEDLEEALAAAPELLVVGRGYYGRMVVPGPVAEELGRRGIELVAEETPRAVATWNGLPDTRRAVAALHLTC